MLENGLKGFELRRGARYVSITRLDHSLRLRITIRYQIGVLGLDKNKGLRHKSGERDV